MMNRIILMAILLSSALVYGQEKNEWRIGAHFQLNRGFHFGSKNGSNYGFAPGGCYGPNYSLSERIEFTTGINANYRVTKNFELSSGLNVTKQNTFYSYYYNCFNTADFIYPAIYSLSDYFLEAPLIARYYVLPNKFKLHFELGQIVGVPLRKSNYSLWENLKLDVHAGLGVDYFVGRFQMAASVNYRRNWNTLMRTEMYYFKPDRLGVELRTAVRLGAK